MDSPTCSCASESFTTLETLSVSSLSYFPDFESSSTSDESDSKEDDHNEDGTLHDQHSEAETELLSARDDSSSETRVYASRYWVLFVYSSVLFYQTVVWNTWGAISQSALYAFPSWDDATIAMLSNTACIGLMVAVFPACIAVQRWGLRPVMLTLMGVWVLGLSLRCFTRDPTLFTKAAYLSGLLNGGLAGIVLAVPVVSSSWFPSRQRVTATAVSSIMAQAGVGGSFLVPYVVRVPRSATTPGDVSDDIQRLMLIEFCIGAGLFVCAHAYFPSAPPLPPSPSAAAPRLGLCAGFRAVALNGPFWVLLLSFGISTGVSGCWVSVIAFSLDQFAFTQKEIAILGMCTAGSIAGVSIVSAYLADKFYGRLKLALVVTMVCSSLSYIWFMLMTIGLAPTNRVMIYAAVLAGQSFNAATMPFFLELCCETTYPVPESVTGTLGLFFSNAVGAVFLLLFSAPQIAKQGPAWISYILVASNVCMILPVLLVRVTYSRSDVDRRGR